MALLAKKLDMKSQRLNIRQWKFSILNFGFLQAENIRVKLVANRFQLVGAGAYAINVEADNRGHKPILKQ